MPNCPVCGKDIDSTSQTASVGQTLHGASEVDPTKGTRRFHNGKWYSFCSLDCRTKFMANPAEYETK